VRCERERFPKNPFGLAVIGRIAGLAHALLVGEPERVERLDVSRVDAELAL